MRHVALFLVGAPGVGKTTLARSLLGFPDVWTTVPGVPRWTGSNSNLVLAAGHYSGGTFDGADTVPYNGAKAALDWWAGEALRFGYASSVRLTMFDGDRFSHAGALAQIRETLAAHYGEAAATFVAHLKASDATAAARRSARGSQQDEAWVKGRVTKAARFAALFPDTRCYALDAERPTEELAQSVRNSLACIGIGL